MKPIKQSVINTFKRIGFENWEQYDNTIKDIQMANRFGGGWCMTTELIAALINWVYQTSNEFELEFDRKNTPSIADFDRVRYFILAQDSEAYNVCID